jgi:hypothetical protein
MAKPGRARNVYIELRNGRSIAHYMTDEAVEELFSHITQSDIVKIGNGSDDGYTVVWTQTITRVDVGPLVDGVPDHCFVLTDDHIGDLE